MSIANTTTLDLEVEKGGGSKHSNTSSDESDRRSPEKSNADYTSGGRSYECTFCKRGFTNAQALGGHMNIHRKDKLKAKQKKSSSNFTHHQGPSQQLLPNYSNNTPQLFTQQIPSNQQQQQQFHSSPRRAQQQQQQQQQHVNFLFYPSYPPQVVGGPRAPGNLGLNGDFIDANLTLGIGIVPQRVEEENGEGSNKVDVEEKIEVDLELRLGHNHKYS